MKSLIDRIFDIHDEASFNRCALDVYDFQVEHVALYREYIAHLNRKRPNHASEIPHLPISFFKSHSIVASGFPIQKTFLSSGTGNQTRSKHAVVDLQLYERSFFHTYRKFIGIPEDQLIFALLPNYVSQGDSSLVYMVDHLIDASKHELSGYYLTSFNALLQAIEQGRAVGNKMVLFGVSYALLDLAELKPDLHDVLVIETGGMKGNRPELTKEELHRSLMNGFSCSYIASEYGMCELLSQAYSDEDGLFTFPNWMKCTLRDIQDPFAGVSLNKTGGVNITDLANLYSCAFIETQDLGRMIGGKLKLMGRFDQSDIRGCNLLLSN